MSNDTITGRLRVDDGKGTVQVSGLYRTDIDDLWSALTEPERLSRWLATVDGHPAVGDTFSAAFTSSWEGQLRVDACEAPHHLVLTSGVGEPDEAIIEAWLTTEGDGTRLVVEERGFTLDEYAAHGAGWQAHIEDLDSYLSHRDNRDWSDRWSELIPDYNAQAAALASPGQR